MAHRIAHLVQNCAVRPNTIQVLMFNSLARKQFSAHLGKTSLAQTRQPVVHTFHSFSFQVINDAIEAQYLAFEYAFLAGR